MPLISAKDATVLAYLARHGNADSVRKRALTSGLSGSALQVAKALTGRRSTKVANRAAKALRSWAAENNKIAEKSPSSSMRRVVFRTRESADSNAGKAPAKRVAKGSKASSSSL